MTLIARAILLMTLFVAIVSGGYAVHQQREMAARFERQQDEETRRQIALADEAIRRQMAQLRVMGNILAMREDVRVALRLHTATPLGEEFANQLSALAVGAGVAVIRLTDVHGQTLRETILDGDDTRMGVDEMLFKRTHQDTLTFGLPQSSFYCTDECYALIWIPALKQGRAIGTVMVAAHIADTLLSFYRVAGIEAGLARHKTSEALPRGDAEAALALIAMTGGEAAHKLLQKTTRTWRRSGSNTSEWQEIVAGEGHYRISRWSPSFESSLLPVYFFTVTDVAVARMEMAKALRANVMAAIGWMTLATLLVWLLSRRLIQRLRHIGNAIQGLETDRSTKIRAMLADEIDHDVGKDELGKLAARVVDVAVRLENAEAQAKRRQDDLRATLTDLERTRAFTAGLLEVAPVLVLVSTADGRITLANRLARELGGWAAGQTLGLSPEQRGERRSDLLVDIRREEGLIRRSTVLMGPDGEPRDIEWLHCELQAEAGQTAPMLSIGQDVTPIRQAQSERERLQNQLQQAHKMEAIGQLAGGIAHDFNNILASILGYTVLARDRFAPEGEGRLARYLGEILIAGERARDLVAQLLAFSRQDVGQHQRLQLEPLLKELMRMLTPLLPSAMKLRLTLHPTPAVLANPMQIQQIVMNLAINARDATGERGEVTINLHYPAQVDSNCASCHGYVSGEFVELSVTDNGPGIAPEHLTRIFEPFFTTKAAGKGTGMGLAIVHGLVHEAGGHLLIDTVNTGGTVFRVLLPIAPEGYPPQPSHITAEALA